MVVISGGMVMEGVGSETASYARSGVPTASSVVGAVTGAQYTDVDTGIVYTNKGTAASPSWSRVSSDTIHAEQVTFTETTGAGTYTGTVVVPAGAILVDIKVFSTALWTAASTAVMKVGDTDDDGWYTAIDLKATDLLVGEEINFENLGGKQGVYLVAASGTRSAAYSASDRNVTGIVTTTGASGSAGRTRMVVMYVKPLTTAATKV